MYHRVHDLHYWRKIIRELPVTAGLPATCPRHLVTWVATCLTGTAVNLVQIVRPFSIIRGNRLIIWKYEFIVWVCLLHLLVNADWKFTKYKNDVKIGYWILFIGTINLPVLCEKVQLTCSSNFQAFDKTCKDCIVEMPEFVSCWLASC